MSKADESWKGAERDVTSEDRFDAIIIGAGVAGSACAYTLAREGKSVLLIDRGVTAGSKNVTGGRLYTYALEMVEPGLSARAPMQRKVVREQVMMLGERGATTVDYVNYDFGDNVPQSYTVLRAPFDEWFAAEAEAKGAMLATGILVDELIIENGSVVGIKAGDDEMRANIVVAADGVNSLIAQKAGLFGDITPKQVSVGVKEIIELPDDVIEARFNLTGDQGAARVIVGCTEGIMGGGFLYTNKGSLSLGIVVAPGQAARHGKKIREIMEDLKEHPAIEPLIEGGEIREYGAHLVPELGLSGMPQKLFGEGLIVIGDAAGFAVNAGISLRGMDLAIVSGLAAARAILKAPRPSSAGSLFYLQELECLLLPTMRLFADWHKMMAIPRLYEEYPRMADEAMKFLFTIGGETPEKTTRAMWKILKKHVGLGRMIADGWRAMRSL
jgi:electron transfer flavoprotein-quinone oxidoreductase